MDQDTFYQKKEGDRFFNRWKDNNNNEFKTSQKIIRPYKKKILNLINSRITLKKKRF